MASPEQIPKIPFTENEFSKSLGEKEIKASFKNIARVITGGKETTGKRKEEERKEIIKAYWKALISSDFSRLCDIYSEQQDAYNNIAKNGTAPLIVRRESPVKVLNLVANEEVINFKGEIAPDRPCNNCVRFCSRSELDKCVNKALKEGLTHFEGIVTVIGFNQSGEIIFNQDIRNFRPSRSDLYDNFVGTVKGNLKPEDVFFILIKIPIKYFPPEYMTEEERNILEDVKIGDIDDRGNYISRIMARSSKI